MTMISRLKATLLDLDNHKFYRVVIGCDSGSLSSSRTTPGVLKRVAQFFEQKPEVLSSVLKVLWELHSDIDSSLHEFLHSVVGSSGLSSTRDHNSANAKAFWEAIFLPLQLADTMLAPPLLAAYQSSLDGSGSDETGMGMSPSKRRKKKASSDFYNYGEMKDEAVDFTGHSGGDPLMDKLCTFERMKEGVLPLLRTEDRLDSVGADEDEMGAAMDEDISMGVTKDRDEDMSRDSLVSSRRGDGVEHHSESRQKQLTKQCWQYSCWHWAFRLISEEIKQTIPLLEIPLPPAPKPPTSGRQTLAITAPVSRHSVVAVGAERSKRPHVSFADGLFPNGSSVVLGSFTDGRGYGKWSDGRGVGGGKGVSEKEAEEFSAAQTAHSKQCTLIKRYNGAIEQRRMQIQKLLVSKLFTEEPQSYAPATAYLGSARKRARRTKGKVADSSSSRKRLTALKRVRNWWLDHILLDIPSRDWLLSEVRAFMFDRLCVSTQDFESRMDGLLQSGTCQEVDLFLQSTFANPLQFGVSFVDDIQRLTRFVSTLMTSQSLCSAPKYRSMMAMPQPMASVKEDETQQSHLDLTAVSRSTSSVALSTTQSSATLSTSYAPPTYSRKRRFSRLQSTDSTRMHSPGVGTSVQKPRATTTRTPPSFDQMIQFINVVERYNVQESLLSSHRTLTDAWIALMKLVYVCCPNVVGLNPVACSSASFVPFEQLTLPLQILHAMNGSSQRKQLLGETGAVANGFRSKIEELLLDSATDSHIGDKRRLLSSAGLLSEISLLRWLKLESAELWLRKHELDRSDPPNGVIVMSMKARRSVPKPEPKLVFYPTQLALSLASSLKSNMRAVLTLPRHVLQFEKGGDDDIGREQVRRRSLSQWADHYADASSGNCSDAVFDVSAAAVSCCLEWMDTGTQQSHIVSFVQIGKTLRDLITLLTFTATIDSSPDVADDSGSAEPSDEADAGEGFGTVRIGQVQTLLSHLVTCARIVADYLKRKRQRETATGLSSTKAAVGSGKDEDVAVDNFECLLNVLLGSCLPLIQWLEEKLPPHKFEDTFEENAAFSEATASSKSKSKGTADATFESPAPTKQLLSQFDDSTVMSSAASFRPLGRRQLISAIAEELDESDEFGKQPEIDDCDLGKETRGKDEDTSDENDFDLAAAGAEIEFVVAESKMDPRWKRTCFLCAELMRVLLSVEFSSRRNGAVSGGSSLFGSPQSVALTLVPYLIKCVPQWNAVIEPILRKTDLVGDLLLRFGKSSNLLTRVSQKLELELSELDSRIGYFQETVATVSTERSRRKLAEAQLRKDLFNKEFRCFYLTNTQYLCQIVNCLSAIAQHSADGCNYLIRGGKVLQYLTNCSLLKCESFRQPYLSNGEENPRHELWCRTLDLVTYLLNRATEFAALNAAEATALKSQFATETDESSRKKKRKRKLSLTSSFCGLNIEEADVSELQPQKSAKRQLQRQKCASRIGKLAAERDLLVCFIEDVLTLVSEFEPLMEATLETVCDSRAQLRLRDLEEMQSISALICQFGSTLLSASALPTLKSFSSAHKSHFRRLLHFVRRVAQILEHSDILFTVSPPVSSFEKRAYGLDLPQSEARQKAKAMSPNLPKGAQSSALSFDSTPATGRKRKRATGGGRVSFAAEYRSPTPKDTSATGPSTILKTPLPTGSLLHDSGVHGSGQLTDTVVSEKEARHREFLQRVEFFMLQTVRNALLLVWRTMEQSSQPPTATRSPTPKAETEFYAESSFLFSPSVGELKDPSTDRAIDLSGAKGATAAGLCADKRKRRHRLSASSPSNADESLAAFSGKPPLSVLISFVNYCITHVKALYKTKHSRRYGPLSYLTPIMRRLKARRPAAARRRHADDEWRVVSWNTIEHSLWDVLSLAYSSLLFESERFWNQNTKLLAKDLKQHLKALSRLHQRLLRFYAALTEYSAVCAKASGDQTDDSFMCSQKLFLESLTLSVHSELLRKLQGYMQSIAPMLEPLGTTHVTSLVAPSTALSPAHSFVNTPLLSSARSLVSSIAYF